MPPTFHPACRLFPKLADAELRQLADDIKANGLRNPIVTLNGKILDGRNRYYACRLAGVKPRFVEFKGGDPLGWVISQNLMRRHLTSSQRAVVAYDVLPLMEKEAKQRQRLSRGRGKKVGEKLPTFSSGRATDIAARIARSNAKYVQMVKRVAEAAPELLAEVRCGGISVSEAQQLANLPSPAARRRALRHLQAGGNGRRRAAFNGTTDRQPLDFYATPRHAVEALLERERFRGRIWEPACGDGSIVGVLEQRGYKVVASDIRDGDDFLAMHEPMPNVVTNPPYSLAQEFVEHAKRVATSKVAMLLPLDFLHGVSRYALFQDRRFRLKVVYVFAQRLAFGNQGRSAPMPQAWFVWDKRHRCEAVVDWIGVEIPSACPRVWNQGG